jgi:D-3-phosphoglycerate dehydrogenase
MFKVLIPQDITPPGKNYLEEHGCAIKVLQDSSVESICREVSDADAILMRTAPCPAAVFEAGQKLKVVARHGAGFDNIDLDAANAHHVQVCNTPTANSNSVAEHTMSLLLACAKNLLIQDKACRKGDFESRNRTLSVEVEGKVLGLIGCGHIGRLVAKKAALGFDMQVIGYDAYAKPEDMPEYITLVPDLEDVYRQADFLSLHVPLTPDTRGMINKDVFVSMKPSAVVLNCARGGIVNEEDLYWAIKNQIIGGAGLDVFAEEPINPQNPLYTLEKVIATPHSAAQSFEAADRMGLYAAQSIVEVLQGKPPRWPVNHLK